MSNHKTIEEYFSERKLYTGTPIFIDGCEYTVIQDSGNRIMFLDMRTYMIVGTSFKQLGTEAGYVSHTELASLTSPEDIVHIGVGHPDNCETMSADEYFGERKIPIGTLVILDGVEHKLTRSKDGTYVHIMDMTTFVISDYECSHVNGAFHNGVPQRIFRSLVNNSKEVLIDDS